MDDERIPLTGVFATRSPDRPNPIGLHWIRIIAIEAPTTLRVQAQVEPVGSRGAEAGAGVEVVDGGHGVVDDGVAALEHRGEAGAVVAYRPVAGAGAGERVAVDVGLGEPGEVAADLGSVGAAGLLGKRRAGELGEVAGVNGLQPDRQRDGRAPPASRPGGRCVFSEVVFGSCRPRRAAFSEVIAGVYFRECRFPEAPSALDRLGGGAGLCRGALDDQFQAVAEQVIDGAAGLEVFGDAGHHGRVFGGECGHVEAFHRLRVGAGGLLL